jgi:hypothetical protein
LPNIIRLFNDAKIKAFKLETQNIIKAAEQGYATSIFKGDARDTTITYEDGEETKTGNIELELTGRKIQNGQISITKTGEIGIALHDGKYCASKGYNTSEVTIEEKTLEECVTGEFLSIYTRGMFYNRFRRGSRKHSK